MSYTLKRLAAFKAGAGRYGKKPEKLPPYLARARRMLSSGMSIREVAFELDLCDSSVLQYRCILRRLGKLARPANKRDT